MTWSRFVFFSCRARRISASCLTACTSRLSLTIQDTLCIAETVEDESQTRSSGHGTDSCVGLGRDFEQTPDVTAIDEHPFAGMEKVYLGVCRSSGKTRQLGIANTNENRRRVAYMVSSNCFIHFSRVDPMSPSFNTSAQTDSLADRSTLSWMLMLSACALSCLQTPH